MFCKADNILRVVLVLYDKHHQWQLTCHDTFFFKLGRFLDLSTRCYLLHV